MTDRGHVADRDRWARLRFAIIGPLLAAPPAKGELQSALRELSARSWQHPVSGRLVRFGLSTLERWYSAEQIILRSRNGSAAFFLDEYRSPLRIIMGVYPSAISSAMS